MNTPTPMLQNLARRLISLEAARDPPNGPVGAAGRTSEKLRVPLAKLLGVAGFQSLLSRALALATLELPWLSSMQVRPDGSLGGFDGANGQQGAVQRNEAGVAIMAQLLGLLVTLMGEPLTLHLVSDAWSDTILTGMDAGNGEG